MAMKITTTTAVTEPLWPTPPPYRPDLDLITWIEDYGYGPTRPLPKGWRRVVYELRALVGR
jgi:hypothetical protein